MNQRCSVLGLIISVLVSAENALTVFNDVSLQSKPMNANSAEHSIVKTKTIFSNNGFVKIDRNVIHNFNNNNNNNDDDDDDEKLRAFADVSKTNNVVPVVGTRSANRFPRQARKFPHKKNNNEDASAAGQHIKLLLDLQSEHQKDVYDYYDDYYDDYRGENVDVLQTDDCRLNAEMENNSKPVTRTLSESQERKRCTTILAQKLDVNSGREKSQESPENVVDGSKAVLSCRDCELLKSSNGSITESVASTFDSRTNEMDDEYLITVLKQLIDRLNKSDKLKSNLYEDATARRSNGGEPATLPPSPEVADAGDSVGTKNANGNSSSEEEWILRLEKTKGIMDKHDSSLENIFVNGKWMKNKMTKNHTNDCGKKPNDHLTAGGSNGDVKPVPSDLKNRDNPQYVTDISNGLPAVVVVTQDNRLQELTTAVPGLLEDGLAPYSLPPTRGNEKYESAAAIAGNDEGRVIASTATTNEESTSDLNNALRIRDDVVSESNGAANGVDEDVAKTDSSAPVSSSAEKGENGGNPDNSANANCDCGDQKVVKNTLSSIMIRNVTETMNAADAYGRTRGHRRLDRSQENNAVNSKNASKPAAALKNASGSNRLSTRERTLTNYRVNEPLDRKPIQLIDRSVQNNGRPKKTGGVIAELGGQLGGRRKNDNGDEGARHRNNVDGKTSFSIPGSSTQRNPRRFGEKPEQSNPGKYGDRTANRITVAPVRNSGPSKPVDRNPLGNRETVLPQEPRERGAITYGRNNNGMKKNRRITMDTKPERRVVQTIRTNAPQTARRFGVHGDNDANGVTGKLRRTSKSGYSPRVTTKSVDKFASTRPGSDREDGFNDKNKKNRVKLTEPRREYDARNTRRVDKSVERNFDRENAPRKTAESDYIVKPRKPVRSNDRMRTVPAKSIARYAHVVYSPTDGDKQPSKINWNVAANLKEPTESAKKIRLVTTTTVNDEAISSSKSKKSLNEPHKANAANWSTEAVKRAATPRTATMTAAAGGYYYDLLEKPKNNTPNDYRRSSSTTDSPQSNYNAVSSKPKLTPKPSQKKRKDRYDDEHAPYAEEDLQPIVFRKSTRKPAAVSTELAAVVSTADEYRDDLSEATDGKPPSTRSSAFRVLPRVKVIDGVFNVPLVGHVGHVGHNGSVSVSDIFIPVENKSVGPRHSAVLSLAELLTGEFRLSDGHGGGGDERSATSEPARDDVRRTTAVPVHIIQIINNGVQCSPDARNCTDARSVKHSDRVHSRSDTDDDDGARSRSTPTNRRQKSAAVKNAYDHFDPEIVDRFLQVYSPPYTV